MRRTGRTENHIKVTEQYLKENQKIKDKLNLQIKKCEILNDLNK